MEPTGAPAAALWPARIRRRAALRRAGWGSAPRRGWVAEIAPVLAAGGHGDQAGPDSLAAPPGDWFTEAVTITHAAVVVAFVRCRATGRRRVVKMPCTVEAARSLRRQAAVLQALHTDPRLAGWLDVVPRQRAYGEVAGRRYWVEDAVPGTPIPEAMPWTAGGRSVVAAAARLAEDLHARTGAERTLDAADVAAWVERPLDVLRAFHARRFRHRTYLDALERLRGELSEELTGRRVRVSWIHGDFRPGNLLISGSAVTGLVGWDHAEAHQLPLQDLLHLGFRAGPARDGGELGELVLRSLTDGPAKTTGVAARQLEAWLGGVPATPAVLLLWLRRISLSIGSTGHGDNRAWLRRNVHNVLARG